MTTGTEKPDDRKVETKTIATTPEQPGAQEAQIAQINQSKWRTALEKEGREDPDHPNNYNPTKYNRDVLKVVEANLAAADPKGTTVTDFTTKALEPGDTQLRIQYRNPKTGEPMRGPTGQPEMVDADTLSNKDLGIQLQKTMERYNTYQAARHAHGLDKQYDDLNKRLDHVLDLRDALHVGPPSDQLGDIAKGLTTLLDKPDKPLAKETTQAAERIRAQADKLNTGDDAEREQARDQMRHDLQTLKKDANLSQPERDAIAKTEKEVGISKADFTRLLNSHGPLSDADKQLLGDHAKDFKVMQDYFKDAKKYEDADKQILAKMHEQPGAFAAGKMSFCCCHNARNKSLGMMQWATAGSQLEGSQCHTLNLNHLDLAALSPQKGK